MSFKDAAKAYLEETKKLVPVRIERVEQTLWVYPHVSARDVMRIEQARARGAFAAIVETMLVLARTEDGKRLYLDSERPDIEALPHELLLDVGRAMDDVLIFEGLEDAEKKS